MRGEIRQGWRNLIDVGSTNLISDGIDEIEFDPAQPCAALKSPDGEVLIARGDGNVFRLRFDHDAAEKLKGLATRNSGKALDYDG